MTSRRRFLESIGASAAFATSGCLQGVVRDEHNAGVLLLETRTESGEQFDSGTVRITEGMIGVGSEAIDEVEIGNYDESGFDTVVNAKAGEVEVIANPDDPYEPSAEGSFLPQEYGHATWSGELREGRDVTAELEIPRSHRVKVQHDGVRSVVRDSYWVRSNGSDTYGLHPDGQNTLAVEYDSDDDGTERTTKELGPGDLEPGGQDVIRFD